MPSDGRNLMLFDLTNTLWFKPQWDMNLEPLTKAIVTGKRADATSIVQQAIQEKVPPATILSALVTGMDQVGQLFKDGVVFVPEMLIAARAMKECMALLEPLLVAAGIQPKYTAVIGTVQGDLHDIGKNLVAMMWKGANFRVIDLGTNVPPAKFVAAARDNSAHIVGLSALLTTTMPAMKQTVEAFRSAGLSGVKILVGGAPVTPEYATEIGADGYSADAGSAVDVARKMVGETA
jgi:5-methyltetrahydrofolate--homocysteine methyltransferase